MKLTDDLNIYISTDIIRSQYRGLKSRSLSLTCAKDIRAAFIQGISYFRSANNADLAVKPLLLYYGVLSLSRGVIMFRTGTGESQISPHHGVKVGKEWQGKLKTYGAQLIAQDLCLTTGTFLELLKGTENANFIRSKKGSERRNTFMPSYHFDSTVKKSISIFNVLSRVPSLSQHFETTYGIAANCLPVSLITTPLCHAEDLPEKPLIVSISPSSPLMLQKFKEISSLLPFIHHIVVDTRRNMYQLVEEKGEGTTWSIPLAHGNDSPGWADQRALVSPFPCGGFLNEICLAFLTAFLLGTVIRYFPGWWMKLLGEGSADRELPFIIRAIDYVELNFAKHVVSNMTGSYRY